MRLRRVLGLFICAACLCHVGSSRSFGQESEAQSDGPAQSSPVEPPPSEDPPAMSGLRPQEPVDAVTALNELRGAARTSPDDGEDRLKLAQVLYRIGDLDAALEECRIAVKLRPRDAQAQLQLGVILMAKQDWRAAATALMDSVLLDPTVTHAHYSLGSVQYSIGNLKAAIQSYRRALELQPHFPDARYRLALVLKLTNQHQEAAQFMEEAAQGGIPQAQYFIGNAYRNGQGVGKDMARAIAWWTKAAGTGYQRAAESLSQLRRQALSPDQPERRRKDALEAFKRYRETLWEEYPAAEKTDSNDSLGVALLADSQATNGITILCHEAMALSENASDELARVYEQGLDTRLAQFDTRIFTCLETIASDGFAPSKKALARIYGRGLGVGPDLTKAKTLLKGLPKQDIKTVLDEIQTR